MKAMILAAGKGTRVRPLTDITPKPMIPIIRKPIIQHIIEHLYSSNIKEIIINTSHLSESIENYLRDGDQFGVNIAYSYEGYICNDQLTSSPQGSAGGMKKIQEYSSYFDDTFIVMCGDAITDLNIFEAYAYHKSKKSIATIVLQEISEDDSLKYGIVDIAKNGRVKTFQEKPKSHEALSNLASTGIYIFEPEVLDFIPKHQEYDIGSDLLPYLASIGERIYGYSPSFQWIDISSISDVFTASKKALCKEIINFKIPGDCIRPGIWVGPNTQINLDRVNITPPVYIGSGCYIEDGVTISGPTVVGANCYLERDCYVASSIVDDYTRIGGLAKIENKFVSQSDYIDVSGRSLDLKYAKVDWLIRDSRQMEYKNTHYEKNIIHMSAVN
jgi:mannose-1-phosphate guanylyltransferase